MPALKHHRSAVHVFPVKRHIARIGRFVYHRINHVKGHESAVAIAPAAQIVPVQPFRRGCVEGIGKLGVHFKISLFRAVLRASVKGFIVKRKEGYRAITVKENAAEAAFPVYKRPADAVVQVVRAAGREASVFALEGEKNLLVLAEVLIAIHCDRAGGLRRASAALSRT